MPCSQCKRPAIIAIGEPGVLLCLHCYHAWSEIQFWDFLQNAAMMNRSLDDMEMVSGFTLSSKRIPVAEMARAMAKASTYNHIIVSGSKIGVINTGDLAKIDAVITMTNDSDAAGVGEALKILTQAIVDAQSLSDQGRSELIAVVQALSNEVVKDPKPPVVLALWEAIQTRTAGVVDLATKAAGLRAAIHGAFGI